MQWLPCTRYAAKWKLSFMRRFMYFIIFLQKQCEAVSALGGCSDERLRSLSSLKGTKNKMY
jgi:hypothetical protein